MLMQILALNAVIVCWPPFKEAESNCILFTSLSQMDPCRTQSYVFYSQWLLLIAGLLGQKVLIWSWKFFRGQDGGCAHGKTMFTIPSHLFHALGNGFQQHILRHVSRG